jgi:3-oxoacyl-[acyl-carrier-protein] synthase II
MSFDIARTLTHNCDPPELACRPFDEDRSGFLISQGGAAALIVESHEHAIAAGRTPLAEIRGYAETCDAFSMMAIDEDLTQMRRMVSAALSDALSDADLGPEDIAYINAHGTGTVVNDIHEARLIEETFGTRPFVNSTKSMIGHAIGASGALETVVTVRSLLEQQLHPSINLDNPIAALNFVTEPTNTRIAAALTQSFGFGGHNAGLVVAEA